MWKKLYLFIVLWPTFITSFLIVAGLINGIYVQSFIYLAGILICLLFWFLTGGSYRVDENALCQLNTLQLIGYNFVYPDLSTTVLWYTNAFLLTSMIYTSEFNPYIITILLLGSGINGVLLGGFGCIDRKIWISIILGIGIGISWFLVFWLTDNKKVLYLSQFVEKANVCTKPQSQNFKCNANPKLPE